MKGSNYEALWPRVIECVNDELGKLGRKEMLCASLEVVVEFCGFTGGRDEKLSYECLRRNLGLQGGK